MPYLAYESINPWFAVLPSILNMGIFQTGPFQAHDRTPFAYYCAKLKNRSNYSTQSRTKQPHWAAIGEIIRSYYTRVGGGGVRAGEWSTGDRDGIKSGKIFWRQPATTLFGPGIPEVALDIWCGFKFWLLLIPEEEGGYNGNNNTYKKRFQSIWYV